MQLTEKKIETLYSSFYFILEYLEAYWRKIGADVMNIMIDEFILMDDGLQVHYEVAQRNKKSKKVEHKYWMSGIPFKEGTKTLVSVEEYVKTTKCTEYSLKLEGDIEELTDKIEKAEREMESAKLKAARSENTIKALEEMLNKKQKALNGLQINQQ